MILLCSLDANKSTSRIGGVMVIVCGSSAVDRGFEPDGVKPKTIQIDMCCYSAKYAALRKMRKDCLDRNPNNVS
jgi:hypothetical protein